MRRDEGARSAESAWLAKLGFVAHRTRRGAIAGNIARRGKVLVVNGHPDPRPERFCAALCAAYAMGASSAGWDVRGLAIGALPPTAPPFGDGDPTGNLTGDLTGALELMRWADRLMVAFPLWLDQPPIPLGQFFDFAAHWNRAVDADAPRNRPAVRPTRIVVTMAMPAFAHRRASHTAVNETVGLLAEVRNPALTFIGSVDAISSARRADWLATLRTFGADGS